MGVILLFVRITRSSFDVKYKAPGFDIFQKSNENCSLTLFFMTLFACVLLKRIFLKTMKLFSPGRLFSVDLQDSSNLPFALILGLLGQLAFSPRLHI